MTAPYDEQQSLAELVKRIEIVALDPAKANLLILHGDNIGQYQVEHLRTALDAADIHVFVLAVPTDTTVLPIEASDSPVADHWRLSQQLIELNEFDTFPGPIDWTKPPARVPQSTHLNIGRQSMLGTPVAPAKFMRWENGPALELSSETPAPEDDWHKEITRIQDLWKRYYAGKQFTCAIEQSHWPLADAMNGLVHKEECPACGSVYTIQFDGDGDKVRVSVRTPDGQGRDVPDFNDRVH